MARGLSQAQLAGKDFTRGYISLIEMGRTRMSLRAAQIIASRLGVSVADLLGSGDDELLEGEVVLLRAESEFGAGRPQAALDLVRAADRRIPSRSRARLLRLRGRALTETTRSGEAIKVLDDALRLFRAAGDRDMVVRTLLDLAKAHAFVEEFGEALNLALQAEQAVNVGDLVDRSFELQLLSFLSGILIIVGDTGAADVRAERARAIAEDVAEPRALASIYQVLTEAQQRKGDFEGALVYARKSLAAYEELGNRAAIGSSWNTIGWVYVERGQFGRAAEALDRAEMLARRDNDGRLMSYVLQTQAELALAKKDTASALRLIQASIDHPAASSRCRAISLLVRANALVQSGASTRQINAAFAEAITALAPHGRRVQARAYEAHFEALSARGLTKGATAAARKTIELMRPGTAP